ncbi:septum formation family protein [Georgenia wangjunii]|uniref:septum formation family protein n=1 Tax=Georgenia wangjunii TaxID=3117730 RepID=UPI002F267382
MLRATRTGIILAVSGLTLGLAACATNSVMELEVGDCLDSEALSGQEITEVETIECSEDHDAEVFAELAFDDGDYPGMDAVQTDAEAHCRTEFEKFVGIDYESSEMYFTAMYPTETSWDQADDRTALCVLLAPETVTGSLEGAAF